MFEGGGGLGEGEEGEVRQRNKVFAVEGEERKMVVDGSGGDSGVSKG